MSGISLEEKMEIGGSISEPVEDTLDQTQTPLFSALKTYVGEHIIHFDVPGHKKNVKSPITEVFGEMVVQLDANSTKALDMLSHPTGAIAQSERLMAKAYGADDAFFLVNGSTFGIISMIMSVCSPKEKILLPRNVHKSAINAVILSGATPVFIQPEIDKEYGIANGITVKAVKKALKENTDAKALFIINPTYFGITSNLEEIIRICHNKKVAVVVDEAHGAHFPFHESFPMSAMELDADMSTISMHKTAGSLTQTSVLLLKSNIIDVDKVRATINLMQTTSASYLLLGSLDIARANIIKHGEEIYSKLVKAIAEAKQEINQIPGLSVIDKNYIDGVGIYGIDETKLVIKVNELGMSGFEAYSILKDEYNIQAELAETYVILAIIGIGDTPENIRTLVNALKDISDRYYGKKDKFVTQIAQFLSKPKTVILPREAYYSAKSSVPIENAIGHICGESIMIYPPGIPLIIPGELITSQVVNRYKFYVKQKCVIMNDGEAGFIKVLGDFI